jgi:hypothetical protein
VPKPSSGFSSSNYLTIRIATNQVTTDSEAAKPAITANQVTTDSEAAQPIPPATVSGGHRRPSASTCESFREAIELGLSQGRNAVGIWQDLISQTAFSGGYQTVKRFVRRLRGVQTPVACAVILTAAGEEAQVAVVHRLWIQILTISRIRMVRVHVDSGSAPASIQCLLRELATRIGLAAVNHFGLRIGPAYGLDEGS